MTTYFGANVLGDLSSYSSFNANAVYDIYLVDGTTIANATINQVLNDGILIFTNPPAITPRRYIPTTAVTGIQVYENLDYLL